MLSFAATYKVLAVLSGARGSQKRPKWGPEYPKTAEKVERILFLFY